MKKKILEILNKRAKEFEISSDTGGIMIVVTDDEFESVADDIVKLIEAGTSTVNKLEEIPILVGTLNKELGYNGMKPVEVGEKVYESMGGYYFIMSPLNGGSPLIQRFSKTALSPCINFIHEQ